MLLPFVYLGEVEKVLLLGRFILAMADSDRCIDNVPWTMGNTFIGASRNIPCPIE